MLGGLLSSWFSLFIPGGAGGIRTPYLLNAIQALSQLSYSPGVSTSYYKSESHSTQAPYQRAYGWNPAIEQQSGGHET